MHPSYKEYYSTDNINPRACLGPDKNRVRSQKKKKKKLTCALLFHPIFIPSKDIMEMNIHGEKREVSALEA